MIDKIIIFVSRAFGRVESDRFDRKFELVDQKLDNLDKRIDSLEVSQAEQNCKLNAIHDISLANLETLEQKLNSNKSSNEATAIVAKVQFDAMQRSFTHLEKLVVQALKH